MMWRRLVVVRRLRERKYLVGPRQNLCGVPSG
jgi:hypothetical protein